MYFQDFLNKHSRTLVMGILNITPDSFYDGNKYYNYSDLNKRFNKMNKCDIIDIGAESSRPGAKKINQDIEIDRISKIIGLLKHKPQYYSIDTYKPKVANYAIKNGFNMINDITGGKDKEMLEIASDANVPIILMHMQGNPENMQKSPSYSNIIDDLMSFFDSRINDAINQGINEKQIIIDPGIGFGKKLHHNDEIIRKLYKLKSFNIPILVGISRKSFLTHNSNSPSERLESSLAVASIAINNGADIIRVHDISKSIETFSIIDRLLSK